MGTPNAAWCGCTVPGRLDARRDEKAERLSDAHVWQASLQLKRYPTPYIRRRKNRQNVQMIHRSEKREKNHRCGSDRSYRPYAT